MGHQSLKCRSLSAGTHPVGAIRKLVTSLAEMVEASQEESSLLVPPLRVRKETLQECILRE